MQKSESPSFMSDHIDTRTPANYYSKLTTRIGAIAGILGAIAIILVITPLALAAGADPMLSPIVISSVILREGAADSALLAGIIGTAMHLVAGGLYGMLFATLMPRMPRALWFVAGILFGVAIWGIALLVVSPLIPFDGLGIASSLYFSALIISHVVYGIVLGLAGSLYGQQDAVATA
jgi:hypothetical protein